MDSVVNKSCKRDFFEENNFYISSTSVYEPGILKESKSFQNFDVARRVSIVGCRSHSLNRKRNKGCLENCCNTMLCGNGDSKMENKNAFASRRHPRWDNPKRLQLPGSSETVTSKGATRRNRNASERMGGSNKRQDNDSSTDTQFSKVDFKSLLIIFLKRSSIYALNQVGNSASTRRKVFWACIMIFGIVGSGYQIIQYLQAYLSYPVVVNMDSVYAMDQEFPAITVCNLNRIQKEYLPCLKNKLSKNDCNTSDVEDSELIMSFDSDMGDSNCGDYGEYFQDISESALTRYLWRNLYLTQDPDSQKFYGHQKQNFIRSCSFNGEICSLSNFSETINMDYGNCFTFNMASKNKSPLKTPFVGPNGGLELELDLEVEKYADHTTVVGARVQVHDPYHEENAEEEGINASPGFETSIALSRFKMLRLPKPYKDKCKEYAAGESSRSCNEKCYNNLTLNNCSCTLSGVEGRHCDLTKLSDTCCVYSMQNLSTCTCPLPCDDTFYKINIFSAVWPSSSYYEANPTNDSQGNIMTLEAVRDTRLKLKVYYDTLETIIYQQNPMYQSSEVFSQIGGQMGLWLGLSLVAIFECVENFFLLLKYRNKKLLQIGPTR